jgi:hypothetical protein
MRMSRMWVGADSSLSTASAQVALPVQSSTRRQTNDGSCPQASWTDCADWATTAATTGPHGTQACVERHALKVPGWGMRGFPVALFAPINYFSPPPVPKGA